MNNKVLVYKSALLAISETFIKEQMLAYRSWNGVLFGHLRAPNSLPLDGLQTRLLLRESPGHIVEWLWRFRRWIGITAKSELRKLAAENARLVHTHFGTEAVDIWPLVRKLGLPMVVTLHGYDINIHRQWWEAGNGGFRRRSYPKKLLSLSREPRVHFIAVSKAIRETAIEFGIPADKISVCYIGIDTSKFKPGGLPVSQRTRRILLVGRLVEKKGVSYLIEAFSKVIQEIADAELVIVGDGPLRQQLEKQANDLTARISFLGALGSDQIKNQLDQARVFCLPSISAKNGDAEGLPIVILEAQACGVPVVTSARGGVGEAVIDGKSGYTFQERDTDRLASILILLLSSDSLVETCSRNSRQHIVSHFDLSNTTELLEKKYAAVT